MLPIVTKIAFISEAESFSALGKEITQLDLCFIDVLHVKVIRHWNAVPLAIKCKSMHMVVFPAHCQLNMRMQLAKGAIFNQDPSPYRWPNFKEHNPKLYQQAGFCRCPREPY